MFGNLGSVNMFFEVIKDNVTVSYGRLPNNKLDYIISYLADEGCTIQKINLKRWHELIKIFNR